jgi:hypothetical protein
MWICPECNRKFTRNNQSHSCIQYNSEDLFFGKSESIRNLCNILIDRVKEFGEIDIHFAKWNLSIRRLSTFMSILIEKSHITVVFISLEPIDEFPVYQNYHHTASRYSNSVKIESADEIDDQLIRWLKQAWDLAI